MTTTAMSVAVTAMTFAQRQKGEPMTQLEYLDKYKVESDGCYGCEFEYCYPWEMPCKDCKYNHQSYYKKRIEESEE